jgi:hypothetical protein
MSGSSAGGGHLLALTIAGTSNIHTITQSGSVDTIVHINTNGSSNAVTVTTGN